MFSRRSFLVRIAGAVLGSYVLPRLDAVAAVVEATAGAAEAAEPVRRLITKPLRKKAKRGGYFLLWTEETDDGVRPVVWVPETDEEHAEATRFYEDARKLNPTTAEEPATTTRALG